MRSFDSFGALTANDVAHIASHAVEIDRGTRPRCRSRAPRHRRGRGGAAAISRLRQQRCRGLPPQPALLDQHDRHAEGRRRGRTAQPAGARRR